MVIGKRSLEGSTLSYSTVVSGDTCATVILCFLGLVVELGDSFVDCPSVLSMLQVLSARRAHTVVWRGPYGSEIEGLIS